MRLVQPVLGNELVGLVADIGQQPGPLLGAEVAAPDAAETAAAVNRLDDKALDIVGHEPQVGVIGTPVGFYRRQPRFAPQQALADGGQVFQQDGIFQDAAAHRVGDRDPAGARHFQQPRDAEARIAAQLNRVAVNIVHLAQDHIHPGQAVQGFHPQKAVAHQQVAALYQGQSQVIGQVGVLEARLVHCAGREQDDAGHLVRGRQRAQLEPQPLVIAGEAVHVAVAVQAGEHPRHHGAVFQHIARPAGGLGPVGQDAHAAVRQAHHVGRMQDQLVLPGQLHALAGPQETTVTEQRLGGQGALAQQGAGPVEIAQHQVQELGPLLQAGLDTGPVLAADDVGYRVQLPGGARGLLLAVEVVAGAVVAQDAAGFLVAVPQYLRPQVAQAVEQVLPLWLDAAIRCPDLVLQTRGGGVVQGRRGWGLGLDLAEWGGRVGHLVSW